MAEEKDISKNCAQCKKALYRAKRYYRNNAYYCNKNCYKLKEAKELEAVEK